MRVQFDATLTKTAPRFWPKVEQRGADDCWPWLAHRDAYGYGRFQFANDHQLAHRVAWMLHNGPIPDGLCVCHVCDNPPCCNPAHLFLGTLADNNHDKVAKGRHVSLAGEAHWTRHRPERVARGDTHGSRLHPERRPWGEGVKAARLTSADVRALRQRHAQGGVTWAGLAREYGVWPSTIQRAVTGIKWAHLDSPRRA